MANANAAAKSTVSISGGALNFVGLTSATLGGLSGTGNLALKNTTSAAVTLSVGNNNANTVYSGVLSSSGGLIKIGAGALTLSGSNTYTGGTTLFNGQLNVNSAGPSARGL